MTSYTPTPTEHAAFSRMQARLVALLLRHDEARFRHYIGPDPHNRADMALGPYRDLAVLFYLRDQLFDDILPRIVRRLSFESPREIMIEEPPARGRVDWERTLDATWSERPGETPLLVHTRQRRRDFATPENMLAVITLLEYRADTLHLLWGGRDVVGAEPLRHPLVEIAERCERELAFPQFAGLRRTAEQAIEAGDAESLEARVAERQIHGANSAYDDLLRWREHLRELRLLQRTVGASDQVLGADPNRDNYLYQLWIYYELLDLLHERGAVESLTVDNGMSVRFRWGDADARCVYELRHDQTVPEQIAAWRTIGKQRSIPGVRPDYYLRRIDPPSERTPLEGPIFWREPGVVWDAKYYRERESDNAPSTPIKRMIADLTLLGEPYGTLLFAFLAADDQDDGDENAVDTTVYKLTVAPGRDQMLGQAPIVANANLNPSKPTNAIRRYLESLLNQAHERLARPIVPRCVGVFLDQTSAASHADLVDRYNRELSISSDLLLCPKPHIGPWRVDLVDRNVHCCKDNMLCQIVGRPGATVPVRPPRTPEQLLNELHHLLSDGELDDEGADVVARRVEALTRRFAELSGTFRSIDVYEHRLRDMGMDRTLDRLGAEQRESLALAIFLVEQLDSIKAGDYSAPVIHITSVLEVETKRRIFACPDLESEIREPKKQTLGKLQYMRAQPYKFYGDWERIVTFVGSNWRSQIEPDDPQFRATFYNFVTELDAISKIRNRAAHTGNIPRHAYVDLFKTACRGGLLRVGTLNALILAWHNHS